MPKPKPTRGHGLLEGVLARMRSRMADSLIPEPSRRGRILDIGCGSFPSFLHSTRFQEKFGVDRALSGSAIAESKEAGIHLAAYDLNCDAPLPYPSGFFQVVTLLAVYEHVDPARLAPLMIEVYRVLAADGTLIITTPAAWTSGILKLLALLRLVSAEEIEEHQGAYSSGDLLETLGQAGFQSDRIRSGTFEFGMNLWATARK